VNSLRCRFWSPVEIQFDMDIFLTSGIQSLSNTRNSYNCHAMEASITLCFRAFCYNNVIKEWLMYYCTNVLDSTECGSNR